VFAEASWLHLNIPLKPDGTLPKAATSYSTSEPIEGFLSCFNIRGCILMAFGVSVVNPAVGK
jgi:hypothetical protein